MKTNATQSKTRVGFTAVRGNRKAAGRKESQQQNGEGGPVRREERRRGHDKIKMQREYEYENHQDGEDANDLQATAQQAESSSPPTPGVPRAQAPSTQATVDTSRDVIHAKGSAGERVGAGRVSSNRLD